ncbi:hypothetical protein SB679_24745, partial [Chryseobacterium sp. SIMBA_029]
GIAFVDKEAARSRDQCLLRLFGSFAIGPGHIAYLHTHRMYVKRKNIQTVCKLKRSNEMKSTSYYPVIMTGDVAVTAAFYITHFRFQ